MTCTLGACVREGSRGVVGLLTTCILFFFCAFPVHWAVQWELCFFGGMCAHFWSSAQKSYGGHLLPEVVRHTFELVHLQAHM